MKPKKLKIISKGILKARLITKSLLMIFSSKIKDQQRTCKRKVKWRILSKFGSVTSMTITKISFMKFKA